jgi:hypothetical protein
MDTKKLTTIVISVILILGIAVGCFGLYKYIDNRNQEKALAVAQAEQEKSQGDGDSEPAYADVALLDSRTADMIYAAILRYYHVSEYPEILYDNPSSDLGYLTSITPTNPGAEDGEFTLHFSNQYTTTTQTKAKDEAADVMKIIGEKLPNVNGVTAEFCSYGGNPYYLERADRSVLEEPHE